MLRKLTFREPDASTLELIFAVADLQGAPRVVELGQLPPSKWLQRIIICPCAATELKVNSSKKTDVSKSAPHKSALLYHPQSINLLGKISGIHAMSSLKRKYVQGAIMRMLTCTQLEREFKVGTFAAKKASNTAASIHHSQSKFPKSLSLLHWSNGNVPAWVQNFAPIAFPSRQ